MIERGPLVVGRPHVVVGGLMSEKVEKEIEERKKFNQDLRERMRRCIGDE